MKNYRNTLFTALLILFVNLSLTAQKPQRILGIAKEVKTLAYYKEQSKLWQKEIDKNARNTNAWNNYYRAERAALQLERPDLWPSAKKSFYQKLAPIITKAKQHIDDSFEYHYLKGMNTVRENSITHFKKAYEIDPDRNETYGWLMAYYVPRLEEDKLREISKKMLLSNTYSNASLNWNYNALESIDKNGIIITNGDTDSMPKWVLQYGQGIRSDVTVINKWFFGTEENYRRKILSKLNMAIPQKTEADFEGTAQYVDYLTAEVLKNATRPVYISSGTDIQFFKTYHLEDNVYVVGNAIKYSKNDFNNTKVIKDNFENKYFTEYLFQNFQQHPEDQMVKTRMNLTYLPALIHLKKHYKKTAEKDKLKQCEKLINKIAEDSGRKEEVLSWFE